jgi:hypothetical protein
VSLVSVAAIISGSLAVAGSFDHNTPAHGRVVVGHRGPKHVTVSHGTPKWSSWPSNRVYGSKPGATFFNDLPGGTRLLASGTMPDGTEFELHTSGHHGMPVVWNMGFFDNSLFGDDPASGSPLYRPHAPYFAFVPMTFATWDYTKEDRNGGHWLIVVGQPGTTEASYSADGHVWQPMRIRNGIAALKIFGTTVPASAQLRLRDKSGFYFAGPLGFL